MEQAWSGCLYLSEIMFIMRWPSWNIIPLFSGRLSTFDQKFWKNVFEAATGNLLSYIGDSVSVKYFKSIGILIFVCYIVLSMSARSMFGTIIVCLKYCLQCKVVLSTSVLSFFCLNTKMPFQLWNFQMYARKTSVLQEGPIQKVKKILNTYSSCEMAQSKSHIRISPSCPKIGLWD